MQTLRHFERDFKILMETSEEDAFDQDAEIKPFSKLKSPLNYFDLIKKDELARRDSVQK